MDEESLADMMRHVKINFSDLESFVFCWHEPLISSSLEIGKFIQWKYNSNVKLSKYIFEDDIFLKLLYEDGTYFEWEGNEFYDIKFLCKTK